MHFYNVQTVRRHFRISSDTDPCGACDPGRDSLSELPTPSSVRVRGPCGGVSQRWRPDPLPTEVPARFRGFLGPRVCYSGTVLCSPVAGACWGKQRYSHPIGRLWPSRFPCVLGRFLPTAVPPRQFAAQTGRNQIRKRCQPIST